MFLGFWFARELRHPELPPGDGPLQTINWLERIGDGELPGRDFPVCHGICMAWIHAPLYFLCGRGETGLVATYQGTSLLLMLSLFWLAARVGGAGARAAASFAICLSALVLALPHVLGHNFLAGHSMRGSRAFSGIILALVACLIRPRLAWRRWTRALVFGGLAGLQWTMASDQGPAVTLSKTPSRLNPLKIQFPTSNHRPFPLLKLRTMRVSPVDGDRYTRSNDPRITRAGHFLRKSRLDELPQLWNALRGDMSLIGPRAEWDRLVADYETKIPCHSYRHLVKPGITGWAQVNYPYGASLEDTLRKLEYDLYYVRHFSFLLDASMALKTVRSMLIGNGR